MAETELHSALIVAVPDASSAVDNWRERTSYAKPSSGVPPHVTILSPFAPPETIDNSFIDALRTLFGAFESFTFELGVTGRFQGVLYLGPNPAEPFVRLTEAVWTAYPALPPYGGAFDSIVPHPTVAEEDADILSEAEADILLSLPIRAQAREVLLIEEVEPDSTRWRERAQLPFRRST